MTDMRTNFQMVREFTEYMPKDRRITSADEIRQIEEHFGLTEMTALELQNLRDFVVLFYTSNDDLFDKRVAMYSITAVIDRHIYSC